MIITVTMNPAVDKTAEVDSLLPGGLNRLRNVVTDAGGKGVNVSKMIRALGGESVATGFVGGAAGEGIRRTLEGMGIRQEFVAVAGLTRTNLKVLDATGAVTELNEPGVEVTSAELAELEDKLCQYAAPGNCVVFAGSLCRGVPADTYARLIRLVRQGEASAFLDADGEAFRLALAAGPDFIKPNREELLEYFGERDSSLQTLTALCRRLLDTGVGRVALSMGADGALFAGPEGVLRAPGLRVKAHSTVGAGDSMVGAFAYAAANGLSWRETAALSVAASAGAVTTTGTKPPSRTLVDELLGQVVLEALE